MSWAKFDDGYDANAKVRRAWRAHPRAVGLHAMAIAAACREENGGVVDEFWLEEKLPSKRDRTAVVDALLKIGMFVRDDAGVLRIHDFDVYNAPEHVRDAERKLKALGKDSATKNAVQDRDGDRCRYCATQVNWRDRRSNLGGTYDLIDPDGAVVVSNVVVCCRGCSGSKLGKSLEEAGFRLLAPRSLDAEPTQVGSNSDLAPDLDPELDPTKHNPTRPDPAYRESVDASASAGASALALGVDPLEVIDAIPNLGGSDRWDRSWTLEKAEVLHGLVTADYRLNGQQLDPVEVQRLVAERLLDERPRWESRGIKFSVLNEFLGQAKSIVSRQSADGASPTTKAARQADRDAEYAAAVAASPRSGGLFGAAALPTDRRGVVDGEVIER